MMTRLYNLFVKDCNCKKIHHFLYLLSKFCGFLNFLFIDGLMWNTHSFLDKPLLLKRKRKKV
jgi:hypothetical protein